MPNEEPSAGVQDREGSADIDFSKVEPVREGACSRSFAFVRNGSLMFAIGRVRSFLVITVFRRIIE